VQRLGAPAVAGLETGAGLLATLATQGPRAAGRELLALGQDLAAELFKLLSPAGAVFSALEKSTPRLFSSSKRPPASKPCSARWSSRPGPDGAGGGQGGGRTGGAGARIVEMLKEELRLDIAAMLRVIQPDNPAAWTDINGLGLTETVRDQLQDTIIARIKQGERVAKPINGSVTCRLVARVSCLLISCFITLNHPSTPCVLLRIY